MNEDAVKTLEKALSWINNIQSYDMQHETRNSVCKINAMNLVQRAINQIKEAAK